MSLILDLMSVDYIMPRLQIAYFTLWKPQFPGTVLHDYPRSEAEWEDRCVSVQGIAKRFPRQIDFSAQELHNEECHRDQDQRPDDAGDKPVHPKRGLRLNSRFTRVDEWF